jgi:hypothetical protein
MNLDSGVILLNLLSKVAAVSLAKTIDSLTYQAWNRLKKGA